MENVYLTTKSWCSKRELPHYHRDSVESTSDWAKKSLGEVTETTLFFAQDQTAGRGRGSHLWTSPHPGHGFLGTFVFPLSHPPQPIASPLFGLSLFKGFRNTWPSLEWSIKAPNDILLGNSKVAGLLLETIQAGSTLHLLVGLGINVLSHPATENEASHLNGEEGLGLTLHPDKWMEFLDQTLSGFSLSAESCSQTTLSDRVREDLVEALNKNPRKQGLIVEVSGSGDLVFEEKTISWKDL